MVHEPAVQPDERRTGSASEQTAKLRGRVEQLRRYSVFADLADEALFEVARVTSLRAYRKDRTLFYEDEAADATFFIKYGQVKLVHTDEKHNETLLGIYTGGQMLGSIVALEGELYPASGVAIADTTTYVIKRGNLLALIERYPTIAVQLLHVASQHMRHMQETLYMLSHRSVEQRAAWLVLELATRHGRRVPAGLRFDLNLSRTEMADLIGATRESMARALSQLVAGGLIQIERRSMTLLDEAGLRQRSTIS